MKVAVEFETSTLTANEADSFIAFINAVRTDKEGGGLQTEFEFEVSPGDGEPLAKKLYREIQKDVDERLQAAKAAAAHDEPLL